MSGIVIGARTGSQGGGGSYSVFYNAVPFGEAFRREAWVDGLQQNQENRSNLALVNTGEVDGSASVFHLEIYDGETGLLAETVVTKPVPARSWHQINGILGRSSPETLQGYIRIEKVSGENPFLAYGVVNDGGAPGEVAATAPTCRLGSSNLHYLAAESGFTLDNHLYQTVLSLTF